MNRYSSHFNCSKLDGGQAIVTIVSKRHHSSRGGLGGKDFESEDFSDCSEVSKCGVRKNDGSYDWSLCVHPKKKR